MPKNLCLAIGANNGATYADVFLVAAAHLPVACLTYLLHIHKAPYASVGSVLLAPQEGLVTRRPCLGIISPKNKTP